MSVGLFFDENVHGKLRRALQQRGVRALSVQSEGMESEPDEVVIENATQRGLVLVSSDSDMLAITTGYLHRGHRFAGLIFLYRAPFGVHLEWLEFLAKTGEGADFENLVWFLPP